MRAHFDPWKTPNRIPLLLILEPLAIAGVSPLVFRDLALLTYLRGISLSAVGIIASVGFFASITAIPLWLGYGIWKTLTNGLGVVGATRPTAFLRIYRKTRITVNVGYLIVVVLYLLDLIPNIGANFNLFANTQIGFLMTWAYVYPGPLLFEILPIFILSARQTNFLGLARVAILSGLEVEDSPFVDDSLRYFNGFLRRCELRIRDDIKLSVHLFVRPALRNIILSRLRDAIENEDPLDFVNVISAHAHKKPEEILERAVLVRSYSQLLSLLLGLASLLLAAAPLLRAILAVPG